MFLNRKPRIAALIAALCIGLLMVSTWASASTKGIRVMAKTDSGTTKEIRLYSGYYALVIGCADYRSGWRKLPNSVDDAHKIATTLKSIGWTVKVVENPDGQTLERSLQRLVFSEGKEKERAILLWFSGHGHTIEEADGTGLGYIVPVDAPDPDKDPIGFTEKAISMRQIETISKQIRSKHVLMAFDSCFSGDIFQMVEAKPSPYIQDKVTNPVRQFIIAGTENEQVPDKSVFKEVFIQGIKDRSADLNQDLYITGEELGAFLKEKVIHYSRGALHPKFGKIKNPKLDKGDFVVVLEGVPAGRGRLFVDTRPDDARVRVLNIKPVFYQGMELSPGIYHVVVSANGYETQKIRVKMAKAEDKRLDISLKKRVSKPGEKITNSLGMTFVYIPPGTFMMGSPLSEQGRDNDENQHKVTLTKGFYLQTTEVTQGQWETVMGRNFSHFRNCGDDCPMESVTWHNVQEFIRRLNQEEGSSRYRLPTEAEWEYACRAGSTTAIYTGNLRILGKRNAPALDAIAWHGGNSCVDYPGGVDCAWWKGKESSCPKCGPFPVGQKEPNAWGLYDMIGNVYEWCQDWYGEYPPGPQTDPTGPVNGTRKVTRGCSWDYYAKSCRSANRNHFAPRSKRYLQGFRLLREP